MKKTWKIAVACFIGGVLCSAVALVFTPTYWWLGIFAGIAGGYVSYEFREVLRAIPVAFRAARRNGVSAIRNAMVKTRGYLAEPHPFFYPAAIVAYPFCLWMEYHFIQFICNSFIHFNWIIWIPFSIILFATGILFYIEVAWFVMAPVVILAFIGARKWEHCYWYPLMDNSLSKRQKEEMVKKLEGRGLERKSITYSNILKWTIKGVGVSIIFFVWTMWKHLAIGCWQALCFCGRFAWHLFRLIHSDERVLCSIDGTLGGVVAYVWLISPSMSLMEQVVLVLFGGLFGVAFGVINWEIVSKRILHVATAESASPA